MNNPNKSLVFQFVDQQELLDLLIQPDQVFTKYADESVEALSPFGDAWVDRILKLTNDPMEGMRYIDKMMAGSMAILTAIEIILRRHQDQVKQ